MEPGTSASKEELRQSPRPVRVDEAGRIFEMSGERMIMPGLGPEDILEGIEGAAAPSLAIARGYVASRLGMAYQILLSDDAIGTLDTLPVWLLEPVPDISRASPVPFDFQPDSRLASLSAHRGNDVGVRLGSG